MHIAICIWGILRSLTYTIQSIQDLCLAPIQKNGHTYEIFIHTYNFSGEYINPRNKEKSVKLNFTDWKLLKPDHVFIENQDKFDESVGYSDYMTKGDPWHNNYNSFKNHLRALNSLRQLALAVENVGKTTHFDGVVYLRPDVTYVNELPIYLLEKFPNTLFLPDFHRSCKGYEYNDRMAMGDFQSGVIYGKKFEAALSYSRTKKLHSEKFTYDFVQNNGLSVMEMPFRFRRTRSKGEIHIRDQALLSPKEVHQLLKSGDLPHKTNILLRAVYGILETVTLGQMYVWNHDDDENQFCTPHPHVSFPQLETYKREAEARAVIRIAENKKKNQIVTLSPTEIPPPKVTAVGEDQQPTAKPNKQDVLIIPGTPVPQKSVNGSHPHRHHPDGQHHNHPKTRAQSGLNPGPDGGPKVHKRARGGGVDDRISSSGSGGSIDGSSIAVDGKTRNLRRRKQQQQLKLSVL